MKIVKYLSIVLALGLILCVFTACGENNTNNGSANPVVQYNSVEEAVQVVGHLCPLPSIYERYNKEASVIDNKLIQIVYSDDQDGILVLREQRGTEKDISGVYGEYAYNEIIKVDDVDVNVRGESGDSIELVTWNDGAYAHSISYKQGHSLEEVTDVVKEING